MEKKSIFKHKIVLDVRYDDLDTMGHVNNKVYLSYLEEARISYHKEVMDFDPKSLDFGIVVARIDISYKAPIFLGDKVEIHSRCSRIGKKSFDIETLIYRKGQKQENELQLAAQSTVTLASFDIKTGKSMPNPPEAMEMIKKYEGQQVELSA